MFNIEEELKKLPDKTGVYIMHDKDDKIIYVGKAISLKNRVRSYFRKTNKTKRIENMDFKYRLITFGLLYCYPVYRGILLHARK